MRAAARPPLSPAAFQAETGVSCETLGRLQDHAALLRHWQARINLVSRDSLADLWRRHMLDSAQLLPLIPAGAGSLLDIGSGAGFPGLVLAIMGVADVVLVEANARKATFLREAARRTGTEVTIHDKRLEDLPPLGAGAVTARAVAPLDRLLTMAEPHLGPRAVCLFPKGRSVRGELTAARKAWTMIETLIPSRADPSGCLVRLEGVSRVTHRGG